MHYYLVVYVSFTNHEINLVDFLWDFLISSSCNKQTLLLVYELVPINPYGSWPHHRIVECGFLLQQKSTVCPPGRHREHRYWLRHLSPSRIHCHIIGALIAFVVFTTKQAPNSALLPLTMLPLSFHVPVLRHRPFSRPFPIFCVPIFWEILPHHITTTQT